MQVIITHPKADFDALASLLAAKKLYPQAVAVMPKGLDRNVREFMALHRHSLDLRGLKDIELHKITRLIIVETRSLRRLGDFKVLIGKPGIEIHIYDHHPPSEGDIEGDLMFIEEKGATVTILLKLIREKKIPISPLEATIFALGIYEDTGSFSFPSTTPEDLEAAAFLVSQGANLEVVSNFIHRSLTERQRKILHDLILSTRYYDIHGTKIALSSITADGYIDELSLLGHKLCDLENVEAVFVLAQMKDLVYIIGRSKTEAVDVGAILKKLGGGGHRQAAAGAVKDPDAKRVESQLVSLLQQSVSPKITAKSIMSHPVKTIKPETTIEEASKIMLRYGHSGLCVAEEGKLMGIISRRDIDKAKHHGYHKAPVKAYMTKEVITVPPEASLRELETLIIEKDIGRLPVIEKDQIVGIVTRTDILKALHGLDFSAHFTTYRQGGQESSNIAKILQERLEPRVYQLLKETGIVGDEIGMPVFTVGGFVRDLILGVRNLDVDILVEGDGIEFAKRLSQRFKAKMKYHKEFGTAIVIVPNGLKMDIATARAEFYEYPAALPKVEHASVKEDLYRRDFTFNAMAVQLNQNKFGSLLDFFGGWRDLEEGIVRVLHNLSFVEDPTRIFRAIRFEQRYGFKIHPQTEDLIRQALQSELVSKLSYDRIREELILILSEPDPIPAIKRMEQLDVLKYIHPEAKLTEKTYQNLQRAQQTLQWLQKETFARQPKKGHPKKSLDFLLVQSWLVYYLVLFSDLSPKELRALSQKLKLNRKQIQAATLVSETVPQLLWTLENQSPMSPYQIYKMLSPLPMEVLSFMLVKTESQLAHQRIVLFLKELQDVQLKIKGEDLLKLGYQPGPLIGKALEATKAAKLDGRIKDFQEELQFAQKFIEAQKKEQSGEP